jgi:uncharacterized protein (TIGR02594 family)
MNLLKTLTVISAVVLASTAYAAPRNQNRVTPTQNTTTSYANLDDETHASYWTRAHNLSTTTVQQHVEAKAKVKKPVHRVQKKANPVVVAKQYEGLDARRHRAALRNLMDIDPLRIPWCAGFVNAVLYQSGVQGTSSLQARSFLQWGSSTRTPQKGDIVVFTRGRSRAAGHVGFYMGQEVVDGVRYILVLGGNQNKAVNVAYYPANKVLGFRTFG